MGSVLSLARRAAKDRRLTGCAVLLGFFLSSCSGAGLKAPLKVGLPGDPGTVDPHLHNEVVPWSFLCNFYDGLVRFSARMQLEPALAESWEWRDARHVVFHLRDGILFHNGKLLTSADVVASFRRARDHPRSGVRHYLAGIRTVSAEGPRTVVVETEAPAPSLLNRLVFLFIVPQEDEGVNEITAPVGTGAYRLLGRRSGGNYHARAFAGWSGEPEIKRVVFVPIPDDAERTRRFLDGDLDVAVGLADERLVDVLRRPSLKVLVQPTLRVRLLVVIPQAANGEAARALADARVRRALLLGIDRERLADAVFHGNATVASQLVHPAVFGFDPILQPLPFDPGRARQLLAEAGFSDGFTVEMGHGPLPPAFLSSLTEDLERINVRVRPVLVPFHELLQRAKDHTIPLFVMGRRCQTGDASEFLDSSIHSVDMARGFGGENYAAFSDAEADRLIEAANIELDPDRRLMLLQQAQRRALAGLPMIPLLVQWDHIGVSSRVAMETRHDSWLLVASYRWRE